MSILENADAGVEPEVEMIVATMTRSSTLNASMIS
jgi:hypothetical protein